MDYLASCYSCQAELDLGCSLFCVIPVHNPASQHRLKPPPLLWLLGETQVHEGGRYHFVVHIIAQKKEQRKSPGVRGLNRMSI